MTFPTVPKTRTRRIPRAVLVAAMVLVSSYCSHGGRQTENLGLSSDETYLVDAYVRIARARDLHSVTYLESERLFAALDSTIDTTRISNTIRELNLNPERWVAVFRSIEQAMESDSSRLSSEKDR